MFISTLFRISETYISFRFIIDILHFPDNEVNKPEKLY